MPKRTARPRVRRRNLDGIEYLSALVTVAVGPHVWGDETQQRHEVRRVVGLWLQLRDGQMAEGPPDRSLGSHWCYTALELRENPAAADDPSLLLARDDDELQRMREDAQVEHGRFAEIARDEFDALLARRAAAG